MKPQLTSFTVMYLALLTLFSCSEKEKLADAKDMTLTPIVNQKLANTLHSHATEVLDGEAVIRVFQHKNHYELVVLLAPEVSATKTRVFRLQTEHVPKVPERTLNKQQHGRVFFFKDAFLLQLAGEKRLYAAQISNAPEQRNTEEVNEILATNAFLTSNGYGISKHEGNWSIAAFLRFDGVRLMDFLLQIGDYNTARTEGECGCSGGEGATSCSCSMDGDNCSTTCGSGYYACCYGPVGCTCKKVKKGTDEEITPPQR